MTRPKAQPIICSIGSAPSTPDELLVEAVIEIAQAVGVDAELVEHGGVQVLDVQPLGDGGCAELVGLAKAGAPLDPAAGHPHREAVSVVVAAGPLGVLGGGLAAELAAPDHQGLVEQAAPLQVLEQPGDRLVGTAGVVVVVVLEVAVSVPIAVVVRTAGIELDEPDAALDQAAGQETAAAEVLGPFLVETVERPGLRRLLRQVDGLGACRCIEKAIS